MWIDRIHIRLFQEQDDPYLWAPGFVHVEAWLLFSFRCWMESQEKDAGGNLEITVYEIIAIPPFFLVGHNHAIPALRISVKLQDPIPQSQDMHDISPLGVPGWKP